MLISNSAPLMPSHLAAGFQPARNVMQMVNTINNKIATTRTDSFTKSAELEERVRTMMLEEESKAEKSRLVQPGDFFGFMEKSPFESRMTTINQTARFISNAKDEVSLLKKHEAILADESTSDEQREVSMKASQQLKKMIESSLTLTIEVNSNLSDGAGRCYDKANNTDRFSKLVERTGDLSASGLGLTGFESINSDQILEKLDGALAHLNEMGKLLNPDYVPPVIAPLSQEELNCFEDVVENWDYIVQKYGGSGEPTNLIPTSTFSATA